MTDVVASIVFDGAHVGTGTVVGAMAMFTVIAGLRVLVLGTQVIGQGIDSF